MSTVQTVLQLCTIPQVCVGLANGNVCVYNLQSEAGTSAPSHESSALRRKHGDIVTHVK